MTSVHVMDMNDGSEEAPPPKKGFTEEEKQRMKDFSKGSTPPLILGQLTAGAFIFLVLTDVIDYSKLVSVGVNDFPDIQSRIGYVLRDTTPAMFWIIFCIFSVIWVRVRSPAMDPTAGAEHLLQRPKNILNNSFEQFVLSFVSQLILVQHLNSVQTVKYIPPLNQMFLVGRVTYWLGYPKYRLFGFMLNMVPLCVTMAFNIFKFYAGYV